MPSEALVRIEDDGRIVGANASEAETLSEMAGGIYRAVFTTPRGRSLNQNGLYWAMCTLIAENYPGDLTKENVSDAIKIECGHAYVWKSASGEFRRSPKSIAFNKMPADEFGKFLDKALFKAGELFGEGLAEAARRELESMGT